MTDVSTTDWNFSGRTVVITGAARGIGLAVATAFVKASADVFMVDVDEAAVSAAATSVGATAHAADVTDSGRVEAVIADIAANTGHIDVLVNNAGLLRDQVLWKMSDEEWELVLDVHAGGTFRFTRACVPHFRAQGKGRVINVTSYSGLRGNFGQAAYATAKAGIIGFTKTAAKELARFGVTVNAISPNAATQMVASIPDATRAGLEASIPAGRFAEPSEIAGGIMFLASDEAAYVTGVVLPIDGGLSI
jgi:3-oxoacyl-[acyl-carrier protein] reductase